MTPDSIEIAGWPADEARRRSRKMSDWHYEWTMRHVDRAPFGMEQRPEGSDYNLHHLEVDPPADAEAEYLQRQREIMLADHGTGQRRRGQPGIESRFLGAVFSAALGDAMGYRVAAVGAEALRRQNERWFTEPAFPNGVAPVSPNTQLMLFTAESMIGPHAADRAIPGPPLTTNPAMHVTFGYRRWAVTQGFPPDDVFGPLPQEYRNTGWLVRHRDMFDRRSADDTLATLLIRHAREERDFGRCEGPGCVARAVPLALWTDDPALGFKIGVDSARLTHPRPEDHLAAGAFVVLLQQLLRGQPLPAAIAAARLLNQPEAAPVVQAIDAAVELARTVEAPASPQQLTATFGGITTGAQALGAAVYAVVVTDYVRETLSLATNHDGDTAATGMLAGALAGARWGIETVPRGLLAPLDLYQVIEVLTRDLLAEFGPQPPNDPLWIRRYWHD
ncbi:ADP-ribosylglycohydrolase family protein [Amycolatopsis tucumanensis]|uniref:ADP-ribosylglycohydrolase family protein n=1 Tax=Amycolatopsis tucumanensis TaxID=401106 RepID=A0ABP7I3Q7_9PSEU|nr:ADP-ribosylglycohydrolase family protein [Amycolatopsis tucumanensis]MCF6428440.1 ADP-ribosylglycohydrolase family protein [Amycolatopsis tucumanensis]